MSQKGTRMLADEELCLCFHVSYRKVIRYVEKHSIKVPSLVSECFGAGTGCGWCRKQIRRLVDDIDANPPGSQDLNVWIGDRSPSASVHREGREQHRRAKASEAKEGTDGTVT